MKSGLNGSVKLTAQRRKVEPIPGVQEPVLTIYGNPPAMIRVTDDRLLPMAQAIAAMVLRRQVYLVSPSQTALSDPTGATPTPAPVAAQQGWPNQPPTQAAPAPAPAAAPPAKANGCPRCGGTGQTTRGQCHICHGSGVAR